MFCPKCRYEYIPGVFTCSDCGVDLVEMLPEKAEDPPATDSDLVAVYEPANQADLALAKVILDEERIVYYVFDTTVHYGVSKRPALMVKTGDAERARQLLIDIADSRVDEADGEGTKE